MRPFTIWACETAAMLPDIVVHENTPEFPVSLLAQFFGRRYEIMSTLVSPEMFGWPAERYRRYTIMCRKDTVLFAGTLDDFKAVGFRECRLAAEMSSLLPSLASSARHSHAFWNHATCRLTF
jgi:hypothetical protein